MNFENVLEFFYDDIVETTVCDFLLDMDTKTLTVKLYDPYLNDTEEDAIYQDIESFIFDIGKKAKKTNTYKWHTEYFLYDGSCIDVWYEE